MSESLSRRAWLARSGVALAALAVGRRALALPAEAPTPIAIYKSPDCTCCQKWVTHVAGAGFRPSVHDVADIDAVKDRLGVPAALRSCHTAQVGGYLVEGHVPAADIARLLRERPRGVKGLAVPGMPAGSPGMEMGGQRDHYTVVAFRTDGTTKPFAAH